MLPVITASERTRMATDQSHHATILAQCVSVLIGLNSLLHTIWKDHEPNEIVSSVIEENIAIDVVRPMKRNVSGFSHGINKMYHISERVKNLKKNCIQKSKI